MSSADMLITLALTALVWVAVLALSHLARRLFDR